MESSYLKSGQLATTSEIAEALQHDLDPSLSTNTALRINLRWDDDKFERKVEHDFKSGQTSHKIYNSDEQRLAMREELDKLVAAASDSTSHVSLLEKVFETFVICKFYIEEKDRPAIVAIASSFLERMPSFTPDLDDSLDSIPLPYFRDNTRSWASLKVANFAHQNLIRLVLDFAISKFAGNFISTARSIYFQSGLNTIGELLTWITHNMRPEPSDNGAYTAWVIVRSYLWTFWQRARTLHLFSIIENSFRQASCGSVDFNDLTYIAQTNFQPSPYRTIKEKTLRDSNLGLSDNICKWTFELLRNQPLCYGLDFRLFNHRYASVLGGEPGRCGQGARGTCDGQSNRSCLRFHGLDVKDQTAHDQLCTNRSSSETKLPWDEASYRSFTGPKAVDLAAEQKPLSRLAYCKATDQTLAISHVWSHGQGGRPENGINQCLHQRYIEIARQLGCGSYWMDTCCIPEDQKLRSEAISHINQVFSSSRAVLVCDVDIMKIDVSYMTMELQESLLAAVILSDWNTRAWTLLESMKGRRSIFLLCKNNLTVNFADIISNIVKGGRIDIAVFIWQVYHILPSDLDANDQMAIEKALKWPKYQISDIGSWLSYRPASRPGDDFVIWSLLLHPEAAPYSDAETFWKGQIGQHLYTGYLMSSAQRLKVNGLSWAPDSPFIMGRNTGDRGGLPTYRAFPGFTTELGTITHDGLWAPWYTHEVPIRMTREKSGNGPAEEELRKIRSRFLRPWRHGLLLRPVLQQIQLKHFKPPDEGYSTRGTLFAVCSSSKLRQRTFKNQQSYRWTWEGIYEWPDDVALPGSAYKTWPNRELWVCIA